jgi:spore coat polysaccharide biosynthesis predicted glycosyltransferase SpsG
VAAHASLAQSLPQSVRLVDWYGLPDDLKAAAACACGVLLDSFKIGAGEIERISLINRRIAVIDDFPRRQYFSGVVIDWTVAAEHFAYPVRHADVSYLLGSRYCALRPEFKRVAEREFSDPPRSLLVTFGGSDVRSLTAPVVAMLQQEFPAVEKLVVVAPAFPHRSLHALENRNTVFHTAIDGDLMRTLMARADIAVCGGGQTLYELASQGLPPVITALVEDQKDDIRGFTQAGFGIDAGSWQRPDLLDAQAAAIRELWPASVRQRHSAAGRRCVDGHGAERLAAAILAQWKCAEAA